MKVINEKGKLFGKINIIDLIVVLLLVLACVFVAIKLGIIGSNEKTTVEYNVKVLAVRDETYEAIAKNLIGVYGTSNDAKKVFGDIIRIDKEPAKELTVLENGEYTYAVYTDKYDLTLVMRSECTVKKKGIFLPDGTQLLCGEALKFTNGYCETGGEVVSITLD